MNNQEVLGRYLLEREANGIKESTRQLDTSVIKKLDSFLNKPFSKINKEDMIRFLAHLRKQDYKASYIHNLKCKLKFFFNWLYGLDRGDYPECVKWMRSYNPKADTKSGGMSLPVKPKDILTEQDVLRLVNAATHPRDQAMVMLAYESAGRSKEILDLKIGSIQFDVRLSHVTLEGNTGARQLPIISSVPYLQTWLNVHPYKHDSGAYLFPPLKGKNRGLRMESHNFIKILKRLKRDAKTEKPVRPHLLRHARLTKLAKHMTDAKLKTFAGWTQGSRMTGVYVHLAGEDLDKTFLEMHGLVEKEAPKETPLKPRICVRGHENPGEATYCFKCGIILDPEKALEQKQQAEEIEDLRSQIADRDEKIRELERKTEGLHGVKRLAEALERSKSLEEVFVRFKRLKDKEFETG